MASHFNTLAYLVESELRMYRVPMVDFVAEYHSYKREIDSAIKRVLKRGWYILGPEVDEFEKKIASYIGVKHAVGVASGTDALTLSLKALEIAEESNVIVPANVYPTVFGVSLAGMRIKLADVDPNTLNITAETIEKAIDSKTRAVVVVHLYGNPADMDSILELTHKRGIKVIEDCAQAMGAVYKGKKVGSIGDISCFSFYPTKNLGAYGDAGAVLTNDKKIAQKVKLLRMYGEEGRYKSVVKGQNSRLDEIQAAILIEKLRHLDEWNKKRRRLAKLYKEKLEGLPVEFVKEQEGSTAVYHLFVVKVKDRDRLAKRLTDHGVSVGIHYPVPIHKIPSFNNLGYSEGDFPVSEQASNNVLSLPLHPLLKNEQLDYVVRTIKDFFNKESWYNYPHEFTIKED